jgi:hypothetical protein
MTRQAVVAMVLVAVLLGLTYQPDIGTAADLNSVNVTDQVVGPNHAKPLPRVVTVVDILRTTTGVLVTLVLLAQLCWVAFTRVAPSAHRHRSVFRSPVRVRRGPPALALG